MEEQFLCRHEIDGGPGQNWRASPSLKPPLPVEASLSSLKGMVKKLTH